MSKLGSHQYIQGKINLGINRGRKNRERIIFHCIFKDKQKNHGLKWRFQIILLK